MLPIMPCFRHLATKMMSRGQKQDAQIFDDLAGTWWDERGPHRLLHRMNPLRLSYIQEYGDVGGLDILDVGCGGGIVCEPLGRLGAHVTGLDASSPSIDIAREHAAQNGLSIDYQCGTIENYAPNHGGRHDIITAFELIEHVPDVASFLSACSAALKPGGFLFLSTLNRTFLSYGAAILGAEYIARIVPIGTHQWRDFVRPSELAMIAGQTGFTVQHIQGMTYNPLKGTWVKIPRLDINYIACLKKEIE